MTDQLAQQTGHGALFGPQTAIDDKTACSRLRPNPIVRQGTTPSLPVFQSFIAWLLPTAEL